MIAMEVRVFYKRLGASLRSMWVLLVIWLLVGSCGGPIVQPQAAATRAGTSAPPTRPSDRASVTAPLPVPAPGGSTQPNPVGVQPAVIVPTGTMVEAMPERTRLASFAGVGTVTRINPSFPSIELNHDNIPGYMPAMTMEYFTQSRDLLQGIAVGDRVAFTIQERAGIPTIVELKKQ